MATLVCTKQLQQVVKGEAHKPVSEVALNRHAIKSDGERNLSSVPLLRGTETGSFVLNVLQGAYKRTKKLYSQGCAEYDPRV